MRRASWLLLGLGVGVLAFGGGPAGVGQERQDRRGTLVTFDGMQSQTPADWVEEASTSRFRLKQFRLQATGDDKENAELIIFFFGTGQGGSVEQNHQRWKGMFVPPEGRRIEDVAKVSHFKLGKVPVTMLDVHGTYLFRSRPFDPVSETARRPNYRMLAAVIESEKGPYFVRLVGPAATVASYAKGFEDWLKGFK
jgi:hypothetical protein